MSERDLVNEWLQIAYEDYDTALYLFDNKYPKPLEIICYHCHQSVEKSLKGYLCAKDAEVPKVHSVRWLCTRCAEFDSGFSEYIKQCAELEIYGTGLRYPNRIEIEETNAKEALHDASEIHRFVSGRVQRLLGG